VYLNIRIYAVYKPFLKRLSTQAIEHSDMEVSLTYLRGLEVKQLDVEDLPEV
tara:strand:- start:1237 stop:1392 length:156 start_codon:yes stop_codon:yes gene_type:complete